MNDATPGSSLVPDAGPLVIVDLEFTSWEGALARRWSGPGEYPEIVQIGAVRVTAGSGFRERGAFSMLVRPTLNPVLSDYFVALTGITNEDVARDGVTLGEAAGAFAAFVGGDPVLSHGPDGLRFDEDCARHDLANPLEGHSWVDINPAIRELSGRKLQSSELPGHFGLEPGAHAHDALDDSRAIARVLGHLREEGRI